MEIKRYTKDARLRKLVAELTDAGFYVEPNALVGRRYGLVVVGDRQGMSIFPHWPHRDHWHSVETNRTRQMSFAKIHLVYKVEPVRDYHLEHSMFYWIPADKPPERKVQHVKVG